MPLIPTGGREAEAEDLSEFNVRAVTQRNSASENKVLYELERVLDS